MRRTRPPGSSLSHLALLSACLFAAFTCAWLSFSTPSAQAGGTTMHAYISIVTARDVEDTAYVPIFQQRAMLQAMGSHLPHVVIACGLREEQKPLLDVFRSCGLDVREHEDVPARLRSASGSSSSSKSSSSRTRDGGDGDGGGGAASAAERARRESTRDRDVAGDVHDTYNAIAAWRQTDISRGILLDKHVLIRSNMDDLAAEAPFTGAYDYPPWEMNTAVFVLEPNEHVYEAMLSFATQPLAISNTGDGTFQGFVNAFAPERHFLAPFTVGDMRYSMPHNSWADDQVRTGVQVRYKPSITRTFAFVSGDGLPLRTPWTAQPFAAFSPDLLGAFKREAASAMSFALTSFPAAAAYLSTHAPEGIVQHMTSGAHPFRPVDHHARSPLGCHPGRLNSDWMKQAAAAAAAGGVDGHDKGHHRRRDSESESNQAYGSEPDPAPAPAVAAASSHKQERAAASRPPSSFATLASYSHLGRKAYASVMVGTRDINALLMQHQLIEWTNTTLPHIVVCVGLPSREVERIWRAGMHPIVIKSTPFVDRHAGFNKLFLFNLTHFTKLVFLDADAWPLKNVDFMFAYPGIAGAPDNFIVNEFNTGVMVVEPHTGLFQHLVQMYELYIRGDIGSGTDGTDQGFLNSVCASWVPLPFYLNYRFFRNFTDPKFHDTRELFYLRHHFSDLGIVHTYTFTKPHLLPSWSSITDTADPNHPPDMHYEYPPIFDRVVRMLWRAWVLSKQRWGHRVQDVPKD